MPVEPESLSREELEDWYRLHQGLPLPAPPPSSSHKAWVGAGLSAVSAIAGLLIGATQLVPPGTLATALNAPLEPMLAWRDILIAVLTVLAGAGVTGAGVWAVRNKPKVPGSG
jgi:hypothetical protein